MPAKILLKNGDPIGGKNQNLIYIKDIKRDKPGRWVLVYDKEYGDTFEGILGTLRYYKTYHSHNTSRKLANLHTRKWNPGETKIIMSQPLIFIEELGLKITPNGTKFRLGLFKNLNTDIKFKATVPSVLSGNSIGIKSSKGELKIANILDNLKINYIREYSFPNFINLYNKRNFPFDFYLPDYNCCIEYDGEQHYKGWRKDKDSLKIIQERDNRKNQFCENNDIKLLRIPYTDFNNITLEYLISKLNTIGVSIEKDISANGNLVVVPEGSTPVVNTK